MSYLTQLTPDQKRQLNRDSIVLRVAEAVHHLAATLQSANAEFWAAEPEQLVADLNANIEASASIMAANLALASVVNSHLDSLDLDRFASRAPVAIGHPAIAFDGQAFVYTANISPQ